MRNISRNPFISKALIRCSAFFSMTNSFRSYMLPLAVQVLWWILLLNPLIHHGLSIFSLTMSLVLTAVPLPSLARISFVHSNSTNTWLLIHLVLSTLMSRLYFLLTMSSLFTKCTVLPQLANSMISSAYRRLSSRAITSGCPFVVKTTAWCFCILCYSASLVS